MSYIDPRTAALGHSDPQHARFADGWEELQGLHEQCVAGRIYDVERWIANGQPIQMSASTLPSRGRKRQTALEIAIDSGSHSLVLLLLVNGYDPNAEDQSPLDQALRDRRWDLLDLLLEAGAHPNDVDPDALFGTYQSPLFERFRELGVDLTAGHALADALSHHTSNKPLFGFARRHRTNDPRYQKELDIALVHHTSRGNEKGVMLCLWAGADAHAAAPSLNYTVSDSDLSDGETEDDTEYGVSAVWQACCSGQVEILPRLRPDPRLDDFDSLYCVARNADTLRTLIRIEPPRRPGAVICSLVRDVIWKTSLERWGSLASGRYESVYALEALFDDGIRWTVAERDDAAALRSALIKLENYDFVRIVKLLATQDYCSQDILSEVGRTPAFRRRLKEAGFIPPDENDRRRKPYDPPTRAKEVLRKFGVELPKPAAAEQYLPRQVWIGQRRADATEQTITREQLFERVWSTPVETLALQWGLTGRGLAKACARLRIPVPPRGYWARVSAGQRPRRPHLGVLQQGQGETIKVWQTGSTNPSPTEGPQ
jgi:hypothetical protein